MAERTQAHLLTDRTELRVSGDDARTWLNGQVTNDVRGLGQGGSTYAFVLNAKGRVIADAWIFCPEDDVFLLFLPATEIEAVVQHLDRFIIMEDVSLDRQSDSSLFTVQGPAAAEVTADLPAGTARYATDRWGGGFDVVTSVDQLEAVRAAIAVRLGAAGGEWVEGAALTLAHLRAKTPRFGSDFGSEHHPQETGLLERAVSFQKGCYFGQEVVVMIQHRGQSPRVMVRLHMAGESVPEPGAAVQRDGETVGEVRSAARLPEGGVWAFAVLRRRHLDWAARYRVGEIDAAAEPVASGAKPDGKL